MSSRPVSILCLCFVGFVLASATRLHAASAPEAGPFSREQVVTEVTRELTTHFNLEGELQLELVRPWTPPAKVASVWTLGVS